jgi:hypothetical protein
MPPRYLRKASPTRLKPCAEFTVETCDTARADECCGALPCKLCLEWEVYGEAIAYGSAVFAGSSWTGTVGGVAFVSYWERNYETDECEYIVTLDGEEVYRATCYEGASCRDPAGDVAVSTAYLEGTLRWSKHEPRELALIDNPDTGCRDFFCGSCRCSCDCLCIEIREYGGGVLRGEICDTAYDCDPPLWVGTVGYYSLEIALGRDQYGACIITLTADGVEQEPVAAPGCGAMTASVTLEDGTVVVVQCKQCKCEVICDPCPDPDLYPTLTVTMYPIRYCTYPAVDIVVTFNVISQSWAGTGPWGPPGGRMDVILSCVGNSFVASFQHWLPGNLLLCSFGQTSPTNQDCALQLYDWEFIGSTTAQFCCGGAVIGADIGMTVIL